MANLHANEYLVHASERYHATYGGTSLTQAFLSLSNLTTMVRAFQDRLTALYGKYQLDAPQLIIDESWVVELFDYLHRNRHQVHSVEDANAGFAHQFFKHLEVALYTKMRYRHTLDGKEGMSVRYRRAYSAANVPTQQLSTKTRHQAVPIQHSRQHASLQQRTFAPNPSILTMARAKWRGDDT